MSSKKIVFEAQSEHVFEVRERPIPAAKLIPEWWKSIPKYSTPDNKIDIDPKACVTVKQCAPTIDMFSSGYILPLWADILVKKSGNDTLVKWTTGEDVLELWSSSQVSHFEIPEGFDSAAFKYLSGWNIKTPPGWSTLFIHPTAHQNIPIRAIPGIVDTDVLNTPINCPFFIKKDFEGIIKKGTPMVQLIPFKREAWDSEFTNPGKQKIDFEREKLYTKIYGAYASKRYKKIFK